MYPHDPDPFMGRHEYVGIGILLDKRVGIILGIPSRNTIYEVFLNDERMELTAPFWRIESVSKDR
jgi:hypothetical protein